MAKKDVTLTAEQWAVVFSTVRSAPAGRDVETQFKQWKLMETLREPLMAGKTVLSLQPSQCALIDAMLANPTTPWRVEGLSHVWAIREAFGWKRPEAEDFDEEDS